MTHLGEKINKTFKLSHLDLQGVLDGYPFRVPPKDPPTKHCRNTTANRTNRTQLPSLTPATRAGSRRCTQMFNPLHTGRCAATCLCSASGIPGDSASQLAPFPHFTGAPPSGALAGSAPSGGLDLLGLLTAVAADSASGATATVDLLAHTPSGRVLDVSVGFGSAMSKTV